MQQRNAKSDLLPWFVAQTCLPCLIALKSLHDISWCHSLNQQKDDIVSNRILYCDLKYDCVRLIILLGKETFIKNVINSIAIQIHFHNRKKYYEHGSVLSIYSVWYLDGTTQIFPCSSGLLPLQHSNLLTAWIHVKQPWLIWIDRSNESIRNSQYNHNKTKKNTSKLWPYYMGHIIH